MKNVDIIIIGAGVAGLTLACSLAAEFEVLVLEKSPATAITPHQFSSINNQSKKIFGRVARFSIES